eukprot:PhF_6_TR40485/c3_g1_i9/m.60545
MFVWGMTITIFYGVKRIFFCGIVLIFFSFGVLLFFFCCFWGFDSLHKVVSRVVHYSFRTITFFPLGSLFFLSLFLRVINFLGIFPLLTFLSNFTYCVFRYYCFCVVTIIIEGLIVIQIKLKSKA